MKNKVTQKKKKRQKSSGMFYIVIALLIALGAIGTLTDKNNPDSSAIESNLDQINNTTTSTTIWPSPSSPSEAKSGSTKDTNKNEYDNSFLTVHFIDVGQGDATLIECDGYYMLIDAGENDKGKIVVSYLNKIGVEKIDYLIGTHPHSDHIGGLDTIINSFDIGIFIMPEKEHTTKTFEDVLDAAAMKELSLTAPVVGQKYELGSAEFIIIAPNDDYKDDLNNWSVGIKIIHGENSFVFTGDAESTAEYDICNNGIDISADVLHAGHHGSDTSNSENLLKAVNPEYMVISCGTGNSYGHPHQEILERIDENKISYYRTDIMGTLIARSDGLYIQWAIDFMMDITGAVSPTVAPTPELTVIITPTPTSEPTTIITPTATTEPTIITPTAILEPTKTPIVEPTEKISVTVYITNTGSKYHNSGCSYLSKSKIAISLDDAKDSGYTACSRCSPPQ